MRILVAGATAAAIVFFAASGLYSELQTVRVVTTLEIPAVMEDAKVRELSGLAYDPANAILWSVSDKGELRGFTLVKDAGVPTGLKLAHVSELNTIFESAEGLDIAAAHPGDSGTTLLIAFEDGPAILRYSPVDGVVSAMVLPRPLDDPLTYAEENSRLESVAVGLEGVVTTAPEEALAGSNDAEHTIFETDGKTLRFPTFQPHRSNLKAIEALDDGRFLILERTRDEEKNSTMRLRIVDPTSCDATRLCSVSELKPDLPSAFEGNFEGLAKLGDGLFAAVTDSDPKDGETTKLVFFSIN